MELYKKYRPRIWEDIVGQTQVVSSLREMAKTKKVPTGLLFGGLHGSGKTTAAFILAKALNCKNIDENGNPCNECATCKAIDKGVQPGVRYISMANNGGVDEVKRLVTEAKLVQPIKKQVWILDEIQNLSNQAFDSLLIPLESENMKTLFIFCTTEPEKVREAVLSRLQLRNFSPVSNKDIAVLLSKISSLENKKDLLTKEILKEIVINSKGSVRTAINGLESFLDTGIVPINNSNKILEAILKNSIEDIILLSNKMAEEGENFINILENLYRTFTNSLISAIDDKKGNPLEKELIKETNGNFISFSLLTIGEGLSLMSNKTVDYRIIFEMTLSKIILKKKSLKK